MNKLLVNKVLSTDLTESIKYRNLKDAGCKKKKMVGYNIVEEVRHDVRVLIKIKTE